MIPATISCIKNLNILNSLYFCLFDYSKNGLKNG
nr:MAG TPA: hypothetical protein [Caudoviricetes sp.]